MQELQLFELDGRAATYVRDHLTNVNSLCSALLDVVAVTKGKTSTLAPVGAAWERLHEFELGGLLAANFDTSRAVELPAGGSMMAVESLHLQRAERIMDLLRESPGRVCIIDDFNPTWGGEHYNPEPSAFGVGHEVYHLVSGEETVSAVADILSWGDTVWHGISAVCQPPANVTRQSLSSAETIRACAQSVIEITCTAYDREGFVIWTRD